jgi:transglutaminase-like putative cysteine protease
MQPASLYPGKVPTFLSGLPGGVDSTRVTLKTMVRIVRAAKLDPGVRQAAQEITRPLPPKAYPAEVTALQHFVRDRIRYVQDIRGVETVQTPQRTLETGSGDCDDKSVLLAALLESIGHPARFLALGFNGGDYSHVLVETRCGRGWLALETILPGVEPGWSPPDITRQMVAHV